MKVAELEGPALDWAVAKNLSLKVFSLHDFMRQRAEKTGYKASLDWHLSLQKDIQVIGDLETGSASPIPYYSTSWTEGGPLIEAARISVQTEDGGWSAYYRERLFELDNSDCFVLGSTMLEAGLRCLCLNHFGEDIDIPKELR